MKVPNNDNYDMPMKFKGIVHPILSALHSKSFEVRDWTKFGNFIIQKKAQEFIFEVHCPTYNYH